MPRSGRFYDKQAWRDLRRLALQRDGYRCVRCHASVRGKGTARVDHVEPVKLAPHRALDITNLRTLCATCDNRSHNEKARRLPYRIDKIVHGHDATGLPLGADHPWNMPGGRAQNSKGGPAQPLFAVAATIGDKRGSRQ